MDDYQELEPANKQKLRSVDLVGVPLPERKRKCTDLLFLLLFVLFWLGMLIVAVIALFKAGGFDGYKRLTNGIQFDGKICGMSGEGGAGKGLGLLYWLDPQSNLEVSACVAECPKAGEKITVEMDGTARKFTAYATKQVLHYCVPQNQYKSLIERELASTNVRRMISDIGQCWPSFFVASILAIVFSFLFLWLLRQIGGFLIYASFAIVCVIGVLGGILLLKKSAETAAFDSDTRHLLFWTGIGVFLFDALFVLLLMGLRKSINVALMCTKEATRALGDLQGIMLLPVAKYLMLVGVVAYWVVVTVFLMSAGDITVGDPYTLPGTSVTVQTKHIQWGKTLQQMFYYHAFGLIWTAAFLTALADIIVAAAVGLWYFAPLRNGGKQLNRPIFSAVQILTKFHLGSAALGSLLIAIVTAIRAIFRYIRRKTEEASRENKLVKMVMCMCSVCLWCFERMLKFVSRQAFIMVALFGFSFCKAAGEAFGLITRNICRLGAINLMGTVFQTLGKAFVVASTTFCAYQFILWRHEDQISSPFGPLAVVAALSFIIGHMFMQVFDMTVNCVLQCFVADEEAHGKAKHLATDSADLPKAMDLAGTYST